MPPDENDIGELFMMNENGEPVKIGRFSEMPKCEIRTDPHIDLKSLYENKFEAKIELTPESAAEMAKLQKQLNAEIIENLKQQMDAVDAVIQGLKFCNSDMVCTRCPYRTEPDDVACVCVNNLLSDAAAIAKAYRRVVESGLQMMENK